jgi:hypothetical protein
LEATVSTEDIFSRLLVKKVAIFKLLPIRFIALVSCPLQMTVKTPRSTAQEAASTFDFMPPVPTLLLLPKVTALSPVVE